MNPDTTVMKIIQEIYSVSDAWLYIQPITTNTQTQAYFSFPQYD